MYALFPLKARNLLDSGPGHCRLVERRDCRRLRVERGGGGKLPVFVIYWNAGITSFDVSKRQLSRLIYGPWHKRVGPRIQQKNDRLHV